MAQPLQFTLKEVFILHPETQCKYKIKILLGQQLTEQSLEGHGFYTIQNHLHLQTKPGQTTGYVSLMRARTQDRHGFYEQIGRGELDLNIFSDLSNSKDLVSGVIYGSRPSNMGKIIAKYSYKTSRTARTQNAVQGSSFQEDKKYVFVNHKRRQKLPTFKFKQSILQHSKQISNKLNQLTQSMNSIIEEQCAQGAAQFSLQNVPNNKLRQNKFNAVVKQSRKNFRLQRKYTSPVDRYYRESKDQRYVLHKQRSRIFSDSPKDSRIKNQSVLKKQLSVSNHQDHTNSRATSSFLSNLYRINPNSYLLKPQDIHKTDKKNNPVKIVDLRITSIFFHLYNRAGLDTKKVTINFQIDQIKQGRILRLQQQPQQTQVNIQFLQIDSNQIMKIQCLPQANKNLQPIGCCNIIIRQLITDQTKTTHHTFISHLGTKVGYLILYFCLSRGVTGHLKHIFDRSPKTIQRIKHRNQEPNQLQFSLSNFNPHSAEQYAPRNSGQGSFGTDSEAVGEDQPIAFPGDYRYH